MAIKKSPSSLSDRNLALKIRDGRVWLITHDSEMSQVQGWLYDAELWMESLKYYEELVREAEKRSIKESRCWAYWPKEESFNLSQERALAILLEDKKIGEVQNLVDPEEDQRRLKWKWWLDRIKELKM